MEQENGDKGSMTRHDMIERICNMYMTSNIEGGEYSYIQEAGSKANLEELLGHSISHYKLDIRFELDDVVILNETKQNFVDDDHLLKDEVILDTMAHYANLFKINKSNDRETVLKNTYSLNELLHKKDIDENLRSQFVGTSLLYIKDLVKKKSTVLITKEFVDSMKEF